MKVLYFAWLRQRIGISMEELNLPEEVRTVGDLVDYLITKGENYSEAFSQKKVIRAAVNLEYVSFDHKLINKDEIAFFPPVTGG